MMFVPKMSSPDDCAVILLPLQVLGLQIFENFF
jgi:hypothetical protein